MKYENLTLRQMQFVAHQTAIEKGWWPGAIADRNIGEAIALMHSELSEALEWWRDNGMPPSGECVLGASGKPYGIGEEFADVIIRIMDLCEAYQIPLERYLAAKLEFNESRPVRHGGKRA